MRSLFQVRRREDRRAGPSENICSWLLVSSAGWSSRPSCQKGAVPVSDFQGYCETK